MVKLINIILKKQRNIICTFGKEDGLSIDPGEETLNALINTHFPNAAEQINKKYTSANNFSRDYIMAKNEDWITEDPTRNALNLFKKRKSPGPDKIKPVIIEHLPITSMRHLVFIHRSVILLKYTPKLWKSTKVIFIPKPGKKNYNITKAFRPISLSNYFF